VLCDTAAFCNLPPDFYNLPHPSWNDRAFCVIFFTGNRCDDKLAALSIKDEKVQTACEPVETSSTETMIMDIWEKLYTQAKKEYHPEDVTPFVYAHHVVCALESADGTIYTGFCIEACSGVMNLCAERVAALNMYVNSGQTKIRRLIAFRDEAPSGGGSGMPCGACREFLYQLNEENENMEIMVNYETREIVTLKDLMPNWWGKERYEQSRL